MADSIAKSRPISKRFPFLLFVSVAWIRTAARPTCVDAFSVPIERRLTVRSTVPTSSELSAATNPRLFLRRSRGVSPDATTTTTATDNPCPRLVGTDAAVRADRLWNVVRPQLRVVGGEPIADDSVAVGSRHTTDNCLRPEQPSQSDNARVSRRMLFGAALIGTSAIIAEAVPANAAPSDIPVSSAASSVLLSQSRDFGKLEWEATPVNKRTGVTIYDAEQAGYNLRFVTYLARFLLSFDVDCQRWWYARAADIPRTATKEQVEQMRQSQFGAFSASVEVGLQDYRENPEGLLRALLDRYCPTMDFVRQERQSRGLSPLSAQQEETERRRIQEAKRQIALLFGLLEKNQPTKALSLLLADIDNGTVTSVVLENVDSRRFVGYDGTETPIVEFMPPIVPTGQRATGKAVLEPTGRLLRIDILDSGSGYNPNQPPSVTILTKSQSQDARTPATARATVVRNGPDKGKIASVLLLDQGEGYQPNDDIQILITPPEIDSSSTPSETRSTGVQATAKAVLEYKVTGVEVTDGGSGYAVGQPMPVRIPLPGNTNNTALLAYATATSPSSVEAIKLSMSDKPRYISAVSSDGTSTYRGPPIWSPGASSESSQFLTLLPAGLGLEYDTKLKRYVIAATDDFSERNAEWFASNRPLDPEFGPRGRSPIEREVQLDISSYLRFCISGAICCSGVHLAVTPIDVVKTKIQTDPANYPDALTGFRKLLDERGFTGFFAGWVPTSLGWFVWGAFTYSLTEFLRRLLKAELPSGYDTPIVLVASAVGAFFGVFLLCPFEAVRIRSVSQPDYAPNPLAITARMVREEGFLSLFNAVPPLLLKEVPFAMAKFSTFAVATRLLFEAFPAAQEDVSLSLVVSLTGGAIGGVAAAIVSNPGDATVSEMKKSKTELSAFGAAKKLVTSEGGFANLMLGLPVRMVFYPLVVSLQFLVYDSVRLSLGIGSDDLKVYLDVLGGALRQGGSMVGPV